MVIGFYSATFNIVLYLKSFILYMALNWISSHWWAQSCSLIGANGLPQERKHTHIEDGCSGLGYCQIDGDENEQYFC